MHLIGAVHPDYLSSHNDAVMRMDLFDLAITNALVHLHFDKFRSLELKGQAHSQTNNLFCLHSIDFKSVKDFREM